MLHHRNNMHATIVLLVLGAALLAHGTPYYWNGYGYYYYYPPQHQSSPQRQQSYNSEHVYNTLVNMEPEKFKSIILSIPNLKDLLLQLDANMLKSTLAEIPGVGNMISNLSAEEIHSAIRDLKDIKVMLKGIDAEQLKSIFVSLPNLENFIANLDGDFIRSIVGEQEQQSEPVSQQQSQPVSQQQSQPVSQQQSQPVSQQTQWSWCQQCHNCQRCHSPYCSHYAYSYSQPRCSCQQSPPPVHRSSQSNRPHVDPQVIQEIFYTMPQIRPELANSLHQQDPGFIKYIISQHKDLARLLVHMQANTLEYVFQHVPSIGKELAQLNAEELRIVISQLADIRAFLRKVDSSALELILFKVPALRALAPKPERAVYKEQQTSSLFTAKELRQIRAKFPRVDELLSVLSKEKQEALRMLYPHIGTAILKLKSDDLDLLNDSVTEIAHQLDDLTVGRLVGIMADDRDDNVLRKILIFSR